MPACVEFHTDGRGDLLIRWRKFLSGFSTEDIDEIDVYDTTYEIFVPECEIGIDACDTLMGCLPEENGKPWKVYLDFHETIGWDEDKECLIRTELQKGIWKNKRFHGWPTYLEGAELSAELMIGEGVPTIQSEGIKTKFPADEECYRRMFALAKVGIDKLPELFVEYSKRPSDFFLSRADDLLNPSFMEELFWVNKTSGPDATPARAKFLLEHNCVYVYYDFHSGIRPYEGYTILARSGILRDPAYKFPPADRSTFGWILQDSSPYVTYVH